MHNAPMHTHTHTHTRTLVKHNQGNLVLHGLQVLRRQERVLEAAFRVGRHVFADGLARELQPRKRKMTTGDGTADSAKRTKTQRHKDTKTQTQLKPQHDCKVFHTEFVFRRTRPMFKRYSIMGSALQTGPHKKRKDRKEYTKIQR